MPVYDEKYLQTKVRGYGGVIKTNFLVMVCRKKACIIFALLALLLIIDSVLRIEQKNFQQVYLEECKYKIKKKQMSRFVNTELDSDSESDAELMIKLESGSDSEQNIIAHK